MADRVAMFYCRLGYVQNAPMNLQLMNQSIRGFNEAELPSLSTLAYIRDMPLCFRSMTTCTNFLFLFLRPLVPFSWPPTTVSLPEGAVPHWPLPSLLFVETANMSFV